MKWTNTIMSNYIELCNKMAEEGFDKTVTYEYNLAGITNPPQEGRSKFIWFFKGVMGLGSVDSWISRGVGINTTFYIGYNLKNRRIITSVKQVEDDEYTSDIEMATHLSLDISNRLVEHTTLYPHTTNSELLEIVFNSYNQYASADNNGLTFIDTNAVISKPTKLRIL